MDERTWLEFTLTYDHTTDKMEKFEGTPFSGRISGTMARSRDPGVCVCVYWGGGVHVVRRRTEASGQVVQSLCFYSMMMADWLKLHGISKVKPYLRTRLSR